jgi:YesN/AraC family two-component response regulator
MPSTRAPVYASLRAFTSMFRKLPGKTPQHYLAEWRGRT